MLSTRQTKAQILEDATTLNDTIDIQKAEIVNLKDKLADKDKLTSQLYYDIELLRARGFKLGETIQHLTRAIDKLSG
ncbi:unnamed protein product [marine sediment metagenome]|uniref:Uncharacterized protein n=1 Tax=marine sediment metagenome TaxID=412755 RepID=X0RZ88_9ZZZZ